MTCGAVGGLCNQGGASWLSGSVCHLQVRDLSFDSLAALNLLWRYASGQGTLPTRSLDTGVSGYLVGQWLQASVYLNIVSRGSCVNSGDLCC